jgi:hypothetical protein
MFDWVPKREKRIPREQTEALKLRQRVLDGIAADLDSLMRARFDPTFKAHLELLRRSFDRTFDHPEALPITLARIEYKIFLEKVDELRAKMQREISAALSVWRDQCDEMGIREPFRRLTDHRLETFTSNLTTAGLQMFVDMADRLKEAEQLAAARRYRPAVQRAEVAISRL